MNFNVKTLKCVSVYPNALYVENDSVQIIGIRFCHESTNTIEQTNIIEQILKIKELGVKNNKPLIILGDYNPSLIYKKLGYRKLKGVGINEKIIDFSDTGILKVYDELFKMFGGVSSSHTYNCENGTSVNIKGKETFTDKISICNIDIDKYKYKFERLKTAKEIYSKEEYKSIIKMKKSMYSNHGLSITAPFPDHNLLFASIDLGSN